MTAEITYLVANYNNGKYIRDCITSLHSQTSTQWRCLIADDHSTDDSLALIQPWLCDKIQLCTNVQNIGYIRTLMRLLAQADTDIVGILDPDDALYPEATALVLQAYLEQPAAGLVYTNYDLYDEALKTKIGVGASAAIPPGGTSLVSGFVGHLKSFRRTAYAKTAGLDPTLLYAEDRDLIYKLEEVTTPVFVNQALYKYRFVSDSQSHDHQKQELGEQHHRRAYCNALARRQLPGRAQAEYLQLLDSRQRAHRLWRYSGDVNNDPTLRELAQAERLKLLDDAEQVARRLLATEQTKAAS